MSTYQALMFAVAFTTLVVLNTRLFYSVKGEGEPLVLTHGRPFSDHRIWDYQIDSLANK